MNSFMLELLSATEQQRFDGVTSFVGEDASGSFGILAGHTRTIAPLVFGLARFRRGRENWQYLALPGGLLYFLDNRLQIFTRRFLLDADYARISALLQQQLLVEEQRLVETKESLARMEESMLRRLWELSRE
ncbi:F0F1 ATP synthase subunit epsilon [Microbulbifer bruguierae]|uniref:ATP synthase epsilon chain n=1 Tax=Microbulbifer bruguierae TaxID=3029061 RepID=A0ABY8NFI3_9GAMM|nr:F0F1 ATP synthase subunit epsilon [Microbulbifer bruguierae]WGL17124.1 F0F1 ATP synthase subunit epsilon [Microbulbifer bruguierae]